MKILKRVLSMLLAGLMVFSVVSFELADVAAASAKVAEAQGGSSAAPQAVYSWSINSYVQGTTTAIIPPVTGSTTTPNYELIAIAEEVSGYILTPFEQSPVRLTLTEPMTNVNFYYTPKSYTLNFESNGGTEINPVTQAYNTPVIQPTSPARENYQFTGWYKDAACTQLVTWPYPMPYPGGILYAGWYTAPVTLTFNSNNGTAVSPITATPGSAVQKPADPTRPNFRFDGWFYDISFAQPTTWPLIMPMTATTLYAKWTYVRYTITFNATGGTTVAPITAQPGTAVYPPNDPARTGYTFAGWYRDIGTTNPVQWPVIMGDNGFTVYAKWLPINITISFDSQGGRAVAPITQLTATPVSAPTAPRRFGYTFTGWTLNGSAYVFTVMPTQNITLVANWNASPRAVQTKIETFKTVGGTLVPATTARAGDIVTVVLSAKTNFYCGSSRFIIMYDSSFYSIVGVNKNAITPNAANPYYANAISSYGGTTNGTAAQWPTTFVDGESSRFKFVGANFTASSDSTNGGKPLMINDDVSLFKIRLQVKSDAVGSGQIFMDSRWDRSSTYTTGGQYYFYCTSNLVLSSSGNSTLNFDTDYFDSKQFVELDTSVPLITTINFMTGSGTPVAPISGEAGTLASPPANPVREGYSFVGWLPEFPSVFPEEDTTLIARWQINTYNAIFMVSGIQYASVPTQFGSLISAPANPVKTGYTFVGWSPAVGIMGAADKTFTAMFTINTYNANFVVDGAAYATVPTEYGAIIQAPSNPQKTGHTFTGWSPAVGTMGAANTTFTAQFSVNTYNAYFVSDGQTYATVPTLFGAQIIAPATNPTKAGFSFMGWTPALGLMGAADKTFTAQWQATVFNAYFKVEGAVYHTAVTVAGMVIAVPANPERVGYTFTGWDFIPAVMPANDVTINATWSAITYTLTFKVDGTTYSSAPVAYGAVIPLPAAPVKVGHTFAGWANLPATMPAQNLTLNAVFTANTYTAGFTVDGGVYANVPTLFGAEIVAPANPVKPGYTFLGWLNVPATMPSNNVTIPASFAINTYSARYIVDGQTYAEYPVQFGASVPVPAQPARTGYTFAGWDTVPSSMPASNVDINVVFIKNVHDAIFMVDGQQYAVVPTGYGETIELPQILPEKTGYAFLAWSNLPESMPDSNVTITGLWALNSYDVVFKVDGQDYAVIPTPFGTAIPLPPTPVKAGVYFGGWSPAIPATMPAYALEFTALWVTQAFDAVFMVDGSLYATVLTGVGAPIAAPANPTKTGFIFTGWSPALPSAMPAQSVTFTAVWASLTVTLTAKAGSSTIIDQSKGFIYGLEEGMSKNAFISNAVQINGNGSLRITYFTDSFGTQTKVELINNYTSAVVKTYYIIIFGDVDGDGYITVGDENLISLVASYQSEFDAGSAFAFAADLTQDEFVDTFDLNLVSAATSYTGTIDQTNPGELI